MSIKASVSAFAFIALGALAASAAPSQQDHHCKLADGTFDGTKTHKQCTDAKGSWAKDASYTGTLKTGVNAIGGETTGTEPAIDDKTTYELDLHGDKTLTASLDGLAGKRVTVTGYLTTKKGVETGERHIVVVTTLKAAAK